MRGVGPGPVMSPMSKSYRKRERSKSTAANSAAASGGSGDSPAAKKQRLDSTGAAAAGRKSGGSRRASLDSSSNPTFTVPKIFKVTAAENNHGSNSPVANSSSHNASQTQDNVPSVSSPSFSTPKPRRPRGAPRGPRPRTKQKLLQQQQQEQEQRLVPGVAAVRRKRRPYLDVNLTEDDATRILGYRIKIWWPLDKKWYTGEVREYDSVRQSHWIIYDDNQNEWIKLSEECFKLQLAPGDSFDRPSATAGSTYRLRASSTAEDHSSAVVTDACSDQEENPSSRTSENVKTVGQPAPVRQVYSRRRRSKGNSSAATPEVPDASMPSADPCEVQSPARVTGLRHADGAVRIEQVADEAVQVDATGILPTAARPNGSKLASNLVEIGLARQTGAGGLDSSLLYIERWPLSRRVAELLRYIEIFSGGYAGTLIGGRVLRQVWKGLSPVWDIGHLFGLQIGASTQLLASGAFMPCAFKSAPDCANHKYFLLHIELGAYSSVSLSSVPPGVNLDSALGGHHCDEDVRTRASACSTHTGHSSKADEQCALLNSNLRHLFEDRWEDLDRTGLRLTFTESAALSSSQFVRIMFQTQRLNLGPDVCESENTDSDNEKLELEIQEERSSKHGRRSAKGHKRSYCEDTGNEQPAKRVRIDEQVTVKVEDADGMLEIEDDYIYEQDEDLEGADLGDGKEVWVESGTPQTKSYERKRRRSSRISDAKGRLAPADYDPSPCTGNLLIVQSDRGWRELGAVIELQSDGKSWSLSVSLNGEILYSYRVTTRITPGISNKYTHAMMWKGGKDWILEFTDKQEWSQFRFIHDVCCDKNARAQTVKHIPIPSVSAAEAGDGVKSFSRPEQYLQTPGEMEMALSSERIFYDMDSDDEEWLHRTSTGDEAAGLSEDVLEMIIHHLERASYLRNEEVSGDDALEVCVAIASAEAIRTVHPYWMGKRRKRGAALLRCFQPPAWEEYEAALHSWEDSKKHPVTRHHSRPQKPPLFAFCLRPKGLEAPQRPQRQRSQRRMSRQFDSSQYVYSDYFDDSPKSENVPFSPNYWPLPDILTGSPSLDILEDDKIVSRHRSKSTKKTPGRKPQRMRSISGNDRTFIAPSTAMSLDGYDGDSCSSLDVDYADQEVAAKAAFARKTARIAACKAARAQELYAIADAAMSKAVSYLIEAEAIAAAEKAAVEAREQQEQKMILEGGVEMGAMLQGFVGGGGDGEGGGGGSEENTQNDEDVLLPIDGSCWTQEFGSGLIQNSSPWYRAPARA